MIGHPKPPKKPKKRTAILPAIVIEVLARDDYLCTECGKGYPCDDHAFHLHHIKLKSQGGKDTVDNLRTMCWECHALEHR